MFGIKRLLNEASERCERLEKDASRMRDQIRRLEVFRELYEEEQRAARRRPRSEALLAEYSKYEPDHKFYVVIGSGKITYRYDNYHPQGEEFEPEYFEQYILVPVIATYHRENCKEPKAKK